MCVVSATASSNGGDQRRALHAYLSDDAHDTWHEVAAGLGCSVSALLESLADSLDDPEATSAFGTDADAIVKRARRIDADRRRR
jgi:hypothetical protein